MDFLGRLRIPIFLECQKLFSIRVNNFPDSITNYYKKIETVVLRIANGPNDSSHYMSGDFEYTVEFAFVKI